MGMGSWGRGALYDMSDDLAFYSIASRDIYLIVLFRY